ncbi:Fe-S cluster assembly sulfur transfer protein SufU [Aeromicrobium sp.]|uniref:Fe-S cluster assembly sulfur transfer protein SufU n=1 Tax=Aeromicrobium sp. TaxID=1871063 RepID=UPI0035147805
MNLKELYQEIILEHGKNPRNLRKTENFNKDAQGKNPLCGDNVHIYLKLNDQKKVEDISFEGSGCAISMASASIMTDLIKGKSDNEAKEITKSLSRRERRGFGPDNRGRSHDTFDICTRCQAAERDDRGVGDTGAAVRRQGELPHQAPVCS